MIPDAWCIWGPPDPPAKTVTGLVPGKEFSFRVKAVDAAGNESALSSPVSGTTAPDVTPPTTPANLRVTATTPSSVSLAWDRSSDNWAFRYQVLMDGDVVGSTDSLAFRQRHLAPGSTHVFAVRARDSSGNVSGNSNTVAVTLEASSDRTPPTTPTNLTASQPPDDFCGTNLLQWNASADDLDAQSAIEYEIPERIPVHSGPARGDVLLAVHACGHQHVDRRRRRSRRQQLRREQRGDADRPGRPGPMLSAAGHCNP